MRLRLRREPVVAAGDLILDRDQHLPSVFAVEHLSHGQARGQAFLRATGPFLDGLVPLDATMTLASIRAGLRRGAMARIAGDGRPAPEQAREILAEFWPDLARP